MRLAALSLLALNIGLFAGCGSDHLERPDAVSTVIPGQVDGWYLALPDYPVPIGYPANVGVHSDREDCCDLVDVWVTAPDGEVTIRENVQVGSSENEWAGVYSEEPELAGEYTVGVRRVAGGEVLAMGNFQVVAEGGRTPSPTPAN